MSNPRRRFVVPVIVFGALVWAASVEPPLAAQPVAKGVTIPPEPLALRAGEPLSVRTLVQRPPAVPGAVSWTVETRRHRGHLTTSALSPDGKRVATGGLDGIIRVWDAETGEFVRALVGHGSYVYGLAWSPDGNTLASAGSFDGTAKLWDAASGMPLRTLKGHKGYTHHVAWARDGKALVVAGGVSGFVTHWDVAKPDPVKTIETGNPITGVAWGTDGKRVAVSGVMIGVQVWEVREEKVVHTLPVPGQNGSSVAWSPDGKTLVGGGATKTIVWDASTGKQTHELDTPGSAVAFSPTGDTLAVSAGTEVRLWQGGFGNPPKAIPLADARTLSWAPDGGSLFGTATTAVKWCPVSGQKPAREIDAAADFPVQLTPGRPLITGLNTQTPQLWDLTSGKLVGTLEGHTAGISAAAWSRDGKQLATASADKTVRLWDAAGKPVRTLSGHEGPVQCVAWADGKTLASGGADKTVRVWPAGSETGKVLRQHNGAVTALAWAKDGKQLASGDEEHTVLLWAVDGDKQPQSIAVTAPVRALAWAGNGKLVAVGLATGNVEVFTPVGGKQQQTFERAGSPPTVTSLAFAPDSVTLLSGRGNHTAQVWRAGATNPVIDLPGMAPITHVGWSAGGGSMVLSESDRAVRVFDLTTGQLRASVVADGKQAAVVSTAGHFRVADEATCELVCVVQTAKGQETLTPKEFAAKFRHKNNPAAVVLTDK
ncbi:MAG: hypothetical protein JWO38_7287 [Gemmataceae bacterium]|nr:hypothetical protein [Gemmataceae bacterium]